MARTGWLVSCSRGFASARPVLFFNRPSSDPTDLVSRISTTLKENPEISNLVLEFKSLLSTKNISLSSAPSITDMMKIATDLELKSCLMKLSLEFENAGIKVNPGDIKALLKLFTEKSDKI